jgi:hypothetical protein
MPICARRAGVEEQILSALAISLLATVIMLCGAAGGVLFHKLLPEHHLNGHSKDIVRAGSTLIATIAALVLGLMITSAKNTFDTRRNEVREITAKFILIDNQVNR